MPASNMKKRSKYAGSKEIVDIKTGEIKRATLMKDDFLDLNYLKDFRVKQGNHIKLPLWFTSAAYQLTDLFTHSFDDNNIVIVTLEQTMELLKTSRATVTRAKDQLYEADIIRSRGANTYMVNPELYATVTAKMRLPLIDVYKSLPQKQRDKR